MENIDGALTPRDCVTTVTSPGLSSSSPTLPPSRPSLKFYESSVHYYYDVVDKDTFDALLQQKMDSGDNKYKLLSDRVINAIVIGLQAKNNGGDLATAFCKAYAASTCRDKNTTPEKARTAATNAWNSVKRMELDKLVLVESRPPHVEYKNQKLVFLRDMYDTIMDVVGLNDATEDVFVTPRIFKTKLSQSPYYINASLAIDLLRPQNGGSSPSNALATCPPATPQPNNAVGFPVANPTSQDALATCPPATPQPNNAVGFSMSFIEQFQNTPGVSLNVNINPVFNNDNSTNTNNTSNTTCINNSGGGGDGQDKDGLKKVQEAIGELREEVKQNPQQTANIVKETIRDVQTDVSTIVTTAVKEFYKRRSSMDGEGVDLLGTFEENAVQSPPRADKDSADEAFLQKFLAAKTPREIVCAMGLPEGSLLTTNVADHFENLLGVMRDIQEGNVEVPLVDANGLDVLMDGRQGEKLCTCMGNKVYLHSDCYVILSQNDLGHEVDWECGVEIMAKQNVACTVVSYFELLYDDGSEVVIEFYSVTQGQSKAAVDFVFKSICAEQDLAKLTVNGTDDRACMLNPDSIKEAAHSKDFILQFHKCELSFVQAEALAGSQCTLILDRCTITRLEKTIFSNTGGNGGMKVCFLESCPKFESLLEAVKTRQFDVLMFKKIDLSELYRDESSSQTQAINRALSKLEDLAGTAAAGQCVIRFSEIMFGEEPLSDRIDPSLVVGDYESVDYIHGLGRTESMPDLVEADLLEGEQNVPEERVATKPFPDVKDDEASARPTAGNSLDSIVSDVPFSPSNEHSQESSSPQSLKAEATGAVKNASVIKEDHERQEEAVAAANDAPPTVNNVGVDVEMTDGDKRHCPRVESVRRLPAGTYIITMKESTNDGTKSFECNPRGQGDDWCRKCGRGGKPCCDKHRPSELN